MTWSCMWSQQETLHISVYIRVQLAAWILCDSGFLSLQVYGVLSYSSVHCLDRSGNTVIDSAHLHLLHLITVAHLVQILLTSTTGYTRTCIFMQWVPRPNLFSSTCVSLDEVGMDQDSIGSEEEELTFQFYNTLRKHLGKSVHTHLLLCKQWLRVIVNLRLYPLKKWRLDENWCWIWIRYNSSLSMIQT